MNLHRWKNYSISLDQHYIVKVRNFRLWVIVVLLVLTCSACGGGGSASVQSDPPQPGDPPQIQRDFLLQNRNRSIPDSEQVNVSWSAVNGATSYKVQWKSSSEEWSSSREQTVVDSTSTTITGLDDVTTYAVRVIPVGQRGDGVPSMEKQLVTYSTVRAHSATTSATGALNETITYPAETLEPASSPTVASSWKTTEYNNQDGLALINAAEGYAARTMGNPGGGGINVAIIDTEIFNDTSNKGHPDLQGIIVKKLVEGIPDEGIQHGTNVAGAIAARRNGVGMHGVAFNANLIGFAGGVETDRDDMEAMLASVAGVAGTFRPQSGDIFSSRPRQNPILPDVDPNDGGDNFMSDPSGSAHIVNLSFGVDHRGVLRGMRLLAREGRILVAATGNDGLDDGVTQPIGLPATGVIDPEVIGHGIAVGSFERDDSGNLVKSGFANPCGDVKNYCLLAPGNEIYSTTGEYIAEDNANLREYGRFTGTSIASPHVSGAAAVLWAAFPNKDAKQIVQRILTTARQIDSANANYNSDGVSETHGHGALDLGAAMNPVGFASISVSGGSMLPLQHSFVELPPGFTYRPVAELYNTVVYDSQMFPFYHDMNTAVRVNKTVHSSSAMKSFLSQIDNNWSKVELNSLSVLEFATPQSTRQQTFYSQSEEVSQYRLTFHPSSNLLLQFGQGYTSSGYSNHFVSERLGRGLLQDRFSVGPFAAFTGSSGEFTVNWKRSGRTQFDFSGNEGGGYFSVGESRLYSAGVTHSIGTNLTLGMRYGRLQERGIVLGSHGTGAFQGSKGASTDYLDLSFMRQLGRKVVLFGSVSRGETKPSPVASGSLVTGWDRIQGESFVLGGEWSNVRQKSDRFTVAISSPFRTSGAVLNVNYPDREISDGVVKHANQRLDLSPLGREMRLQVVYEFATKRGAMVNLGGYSRFEPDHNSVAKPDVGIAVKLGLDF